MKKKTAAQLLEMDRYSLMRLVVRLQIENAQHDQMWSRGGHPDDWEYYDEQLSLAKRIKRNLYKLIRHK